MKKLMGILCDVLVRVASFIFPIDFIILDYEVDFMVFIILGRLFLAIRRALVNIGTGQIKCRSNDKYMNFNVYQSMN